MVERTGLENRRTCKRTVGSNPTLSAMTDQHTDQQSQLPHYKQWVNTLSTGLENQQACMRLGSSDFPCSATFVCDIAIRAI